jgi:hypothetical protein
MSGGSGGGGAMNPWLMLFVTLGAGLRWYRRLMSH